MKFWKSKKAQSTLELALTFIVLILFLLGIVKTMVWFGDNLGARAQYYQLTRSQIISSPPGASGIGYQQSQLSLFNK